MMVVEITKNSGEEEVSKNRERKEDEKVARWWRALAIMTIYVMVAKGGVPGGGGGRVRLVGKRGSGGGG